MRVASASRAVETLSDDPSLGGPLIDAFWPHTGPRTHDDDGDHPKILVSADISSFFFKTQMLVLAFASLVLNNVAELKKLVVGVKKVCINQNYKKVVGEIYKQSSPVLA